MLRLSKWLIVVVLFWSVGYLLNYCALDSDLSWSYNNYRQKMAIARQLRGARRIFLVGGSATHYSIDATQMEELLKIHTINFGLHAGMGLNAILAAVRDEIQRGDIVLLSPEYGILGDNGGGWLSASFGAAIGRPGIGGVSFKQKAIEVFRAGEVSLTSLGRGLMSVLFKMKGRASQTVDSRGDAVVFLYDVKPIPSYISKNISPAAIRRLSRFRDEMTARGAKLMFVLPSFLIIKDSNIAFLTAKEIATALNEIAPVVFENDYFNLETDPALFSDSFYHLTPAYRKSRTAGLAERLKDMAGLAQNSALEHSVGSPPRAIQGSQIQGGEVRR
jgi:hypothetical protein